MSKELLNKSDLTINYKVLKSEIRVMIFPPITALDKKLSAINVYSDGNKRTDFKITEIDNDLIFTNLLTGQENVFDITELSLGKIYFRYQNGICETFEVKDLEPLGDFQQYLG